MDGIKNGNGTVTVQLIMVTCSQNVNASAYLKHVCQINVDLFCGLHPPTIKVACGWRTLH